MKRFLSLTLAFALMSVMLAVGPSAIAADGSISGTITDEASGLGIVGVTISVRQDDGMGPYWPTIASTLSVDGGVYSIAGVPPGDYAIYFEMDGYSGELYNDHVGSFSQFVNYAQNFADLVTVGDGESVKDVDAALVQSGGISGYVRDDETNGPIPDMRVGLYAADTGSWIAETTTASDDGHYDFADLAPGSYKVSFLAWDTDFLPEWHSDQSNFDEADILSVVSGEILSVDGFLTRGGTIAGDIRSSEGTLIQDASASVMTTDGQWQQTAWSGSDGRYKVVGLSSGTYLIQSDVFGGMSTDLPVWYGQVANEWDATPVLVTVGQNIEGIDLQHRAGGSIRGSVTDAVSGGGVVGPTMVAHTIDGHKLWDVFAADLGNGEYIIEGLETGNYYLHFEGSAAYESIWYGQAPSMIESTSIAVVAGEVTDGIDLVANPAVVPISGKVTNGSGADLPGVAVEAHRVADFEGAAPAVSTTTEADGTYLLHVPPGEFNIRFDPQGVDGLLAEWHVNQEEWRFADVVVATAGTPVLDINAVLETTGSLRGTVTDSTGPIAGVTVRVPRPPSWPFGDNRDLVTTTVSNGSYLIEGIFPGTYNVRFEHPDYADEWYLDATSESHAMAVAVTGGHDTVGIDAELNSGGTISGTLGAGAASWLPIEVFTAGGELVASAYPDGDGPYEIPNVPAGTYYVRLPNLGPIGITQWYGGDYTDWWLIDPPSAGHGIPIAVAAGEVTAGIDFDVNAVGTISGAVTDSETGLPLGDIDALLWVEGEDDWHIRGDEIQHGENGQFVIHVGPGAYKLRFEDIAWSLYATEWWNDSPSRIAAGEITVGPGEDVAGISVELSRWSGIAGTVISDIGPVNLANIEVYEAVNPTLPVNVLQTVPVGSYGDSRIFPGEYKLRLVDPTGQLFDPYWYDSRSSVLSAETVVLDPGQLTRGVNFNIDVPSVDESVQGEVPETGGTVESGDGVATQADPIETSVTVPAGAVADGESETVTIIEAPVDPGTTSAGYDLLGTKVIIDSPPAPDGEWLEIVLTLDASLVPSGEDETTVEVFRNGGLVLECELEDTLGPDPCVAIREILIDGDLAGDLRFTVYTSAASEWTFGTQILPPVALNGVTINSGVPIPSDMEVAMTIDADVTPSTVVAIDWGDGTDPDEWPMDGFEGVLEFVHTYGELGVHTISVTLIDGEFELSTTYEYVVVYDADGSFVTGGGWFVDTIERRVSFGLVARYGKDGRPQGNVEIQTPDGVFKSDRIDGLVITPDGVAEIVGYGTLGDDGGRLFRIAMSDSGVESIERLRVWAPGVDASEVSAEIDVSGILGGGDIKIHRKR